jgi:hypothetical protein
LERRYDQLGIGGAVFEIKDAEAGHQGTSRQLQWGHGQCEIDGIRNPCRRIACCGDLRLRQSRRPGGRTGTSANDCPRSSRYRASVDPEYRTGAPERAWRFAGNPSAAVENFEFLRRVRRSGTDVSRTPHRVRSIEDRRELLAALARGTAREEDHSLHRDRR